MRGWGSLVEVQTLWSLSDLLDAHEVLAALEPRRQP